MSEPANLKQPVSLKIKDRGGAFLLDTDVTTEEGAKIMTYALQLINYRHEQDRKLATLSEEDQIDLAIKEIKKQPISKEKLS